MPRPPRQILEFTEESLQRHLQEAYNHLEDLRQRVTRDHNRVIDMLKDITNGTDGINTLTNLEMARNNTTKGLFEFTLHKKDLLRVHKEIFKELNSANKQKVGEGANEGTAQTGNTDPLSDEMKQRVQRTMREMMKKSQDAA